MIALLVAAVLSSAPAIENEKAWASSLVSAISGGGAFGWMKLEIVVDQAGKPLNCEISKASAGSSMRIRACATAMHGRHTPAHDETGKPISGVLTYTIGSAGASAAMATARIDAVLTVDRLPSEATSHVTLTNLIVDTTGRIESCTTGKSSGSTVLDKAACTYLMQTSFAPLIDSGGQAIRVFRSANVAFLGPNTPQN